VSTNNEIKLKNLLEIHVPGTILLASWLVQTGFSHDLQQRYRKSNWLESVGVGAFKRPGESITWQGALYSLQKQNQLAIHVGGLTALSLAGFSHYLRTGNEKVYLYSDPQIKLQLWFKKYFNSETIVQVRTSMLPGIVGLTEYQTTQFQLNISSPERAIFESLFLVPDKMDMMEVYQIMTSLVNLRPGVVQKLLEVCTSVKVKRLFLYMAKKANHQWFTFLDLSAVNLGTGDRSIVKNGNYNSEFHITIPKELEI
jgi:hypothetical protein